MHPSSTPASACTQGCWLKMCSFQPNSCGQWTSCFVSLKELVNLVNNLLVFQGAIHFSVAMPEAIEPRIPLSIFTTSSLQQSVKFLVHPILECATGQNVVTWWVCNVPLLSNYHPTANWSQNTACGAFV